MEWIESPTHTPPESGPVGKFIICTMVRYKQYEYWTSLVYANESVEFTPLHIRLSMGRAPVKCVRWRTRSDSGRCPLFCLCVFLPTDPSDTGRLLYTRTAVGVDQDIDLWLVLLHYHRSGQTWTRGRETASGQSHQPRTIVRIHCLCLVSPFI